MSKGISKALEEIIGGELGLTTAESEALEVMGPEALPIIGASLRGFQDVSNALSSHGTSGFEPVEIKSEDIRMGGVSGRSDSERNFINALAGKVQRTLEGQMHESRGLPPGVTHRAPHRPRGRHPPHRPRGGHPAPEPVPEPISASGGSSSGLDTGVDISGTSGSMTMTITDEPEVKERTRRPPSLGLPLAGGVGAAAIAGGAEAIRFAGRRPIPGAKIGDPTMRPPGHRGPPPKIGVHTPEDELPRMPSLPVGKHRIRGVKKHDEGELITRIRTKPRVEPPSTVNSRPLQLMRYSVANANRVRNLYA